MTSPNTALYTPYGAYELKAKYQRNFAMATGMTIGFIMLVYLGFFIVKLIQGNEEVFSATKTIKTIAELGPPPTIVQQPPQVKVTQPDVAIPKVGIPTPVADEEAPDEDVVLATKDELADIAPPDVSGQGDIKVDIQEDYIPGANEFRPVEVTPELIQEVKPEYPPLAKQAQLEGKVIIKALVDKEGNVKNAEVAKSSQVQSLDEAALAAAYKQKYKPAIQNGRPVFCWVTYPVIFSLSN